MTRRRHRPIPVAPGQMTLVLLTLIRTDAPALQLLQGGLAAERRPSPDAPVMVRKAAA